MKSRYWVYLTYITVFLAFNYHPDNSPKVSLLTANTLETQRQISYAKNHYADPNTEKFGNLGDTDCANFASQTLHARGWAMTAQWFNRNDSYSRAWVSSTALSNYIKKHNLAQALSWKQRDKVAIGDIVQFDWDNSGDRDHTAIVSAIVLVGTKRELLITQHSKGAFNYPISAALAQHPKTTKVYFWHIKEKLAKG